MRISRSSFLQKGPNCFSSFSFVFLHFRTTIYFFILIHHQLHEEDVNFINMQVNWWVIVLVLFFCLFSTGENQSIFPWFCVHFNSIFVKFFWFLNNIFLVIFVFFHFYHFVLFIFLYFMLIITYYSIICFLSRNLKKTKTMI